MKGVLISQHTLNNTTPESNLIICTAKPTVYKSQNIVILLSWQKKQTELLHGI